MGTAASSRRLPVPLAVVAADAGVSVATISKVINGRPDVAAETRARVTDVLRSIGVDVLTLPRKRVGIVDLNLQNLLGVWSEEILRGAAEAAARVGVDLVTSVSDSPESLHRHVQHALQRGTDGIISVVYSPPSKDCRAAHASHVPVVVIDPSTQPPESVLTLNATHWKGALDAVQHLIDLGHTRIATVTGPLDQDNALARLAGWRAAMLRADLAADDDLVIKGDYTVFSGEAAGQIILGRDEHPTAIFAASDDMAVGVMRALRRAGLDVPGDISIVGFDDLPISAWVEPELTTVHQPIAEMGATAVEMLDRMSRNEPVASPHLELATTLVHRGSTRALARTSPATDASRASTSAATPEANTSEQRTQRRPRS